MYDGENQRKRRGTKKDEEKSGGEWTREGPIGERARGEKRKK